jgi:hypothetical protein
MTINYDRDQLSYALANALKERDEAREQRDRLAAYRDEFEEVAEIAIDILDGNHPVIDWRDAGQSELLRKMCQHLEENAPLSAAVELRQKLATALLERDEAREDVVKLLDIKRKHEHEELVAAQENDRLKQERDEAWEKECAAIESWWHQRVLREGQRVVEARHKLELCMAANSDVARIAKERDEAHSILEQVTDRLEQATIKLIKLQSQRDEAREAMREGWLAMDEIDGTDRMLNWQNKNANILEGAK